MNNLCFILENKELFLDTYLVSDDMPILFTCIDEDDNHYLTLCIDMDLPQYNIISITNEQLNGLLQSQISMKEIFKMQPTYFEVKPIDQDAMHDVVTKKEMKEIDPSELPQNTMFTLFNLALEEYAATIKAKEMEYGD